MPDKNILVQALLMGISATAITDLWLLILQWGSGSTIVNWGLVGRWLGHIPRGRFLHSPITETNAIRYESLLGWTFHYFTGLIYAVLYLLVLVVFGSDTTPELESALTFGLVTVLAPWLILQPALGSGLFAHKTPSPWRIRVINISVHLIFGLGLYLSWLVYFVVTNLH